MANLLNSATTSEPFNVRNYGAIGDGVADDSTAINAALTAAGNFAVGNGGATVVIPPGKYKINSTLVLKDNCTLMAYGAYIFAGGVVYMLNGYTSLGTGYTGGHSNLTILGGIWDAKAQDRAALDAERHNIMTFANSRGLLIRDATFRNVPGFHAVDINTVDGVVIDGCRFEGFRDNSTTPGSRFFSEAVQLDNDGATDLPTINVSMTNCYMGPAIDGTGHGSFGKLVGSHSSVVNEFYTNIRIIGNVADDPIDVGIEGENWKNCVVSGNVITSATNDAIRMVLDTNSVSSGIVISDNVCEGYGRSGISFDSGGASQSFSDCTITGNTLVTTTATGPNINLESVNGSSVSNNTIKGGTSHGILISNTGAACNDMSITGNNIREVDVHGIQVQGGARHHVSGNRLYDVGQNGIYLTAGVSKSTISNNSVIGAGRATNNIYGALALSNNGGNANNIFSSNRIQKFGSGNEALTPVLFDGSGPVDNEFRQNSFDGWSTTYISNFTLNGAFLHDGERVRYVVKSADQSLTSNATFQNDSQLTLPVAANAVYVVEGYVAFNAGTTGDIKVQFTGPASSTIRVTAYGTTSATTLTDYDVTSNPASSSRAMGGNGATDMSLQPKGTIVTGGTAGSITLQWAQNTSDGTATIVRQNSWLKITRVS